MSDQLTVFFVNATFVALVAASALTWAIVIVKGLQARRVTRQAQAFERAFEGTQGLPAAGKLKDYPGPVSRVALAGVEAWSESEKAEDGTPSDLDLRRDLLERSLKQQLQRERRAVETGLPVLASVGSTAPFIGLFGTVLGIIHALSAISGSGSASLDVVAGPIGEALVATAVGIAVAVPAVLAYNYFLRRLKTFSAELEDFANGFVGSAVKSSFVRIGRASGEVARERQLGVRREASA
ncbi:MAG: MotA/TolQ/ExbB proton channel family protein [Polyangiales bacterium]